MAYCARVERREVVATGRCDTDLLAEALFEDPLLERLDMLRLYVSSEGFGWIEKSILERVCTRDSYLKVCLRGSCARSC